jgi:hypothetical protein
MKKRLSIILTILLITVFLVPSRVATGQDVTPTQAPDRPLIVIESYYLDVDAVKPGHNFKLLLSIKNMGQSTARNLIFTFTGTDFLPQETGGVKAVDPLDAGKTRTVEQPLLATTDLWGASTGTVNVALSYTGPGGETYSSSFVVTINVVGWVGAANTSTPTPTATTMPRAQLGIMAYHTDVDPLQPGSIFTLEMDVRNLGNGDAKGVSMILGGGSSGGANAEGTPQPGGISGSGADLSTFAPIESSNVQFLGDIATGATTRTSQKLIVNVSANPGAYALKLSFVYLDAKGNRQVDDQVITLLIFQLPLVEASFYRDPGPVMANQPNTLPIQVVNLGRKLVILGNMTVSAENAQLSNNTMLIGTLDVGGYFPLDVTFIPSAPGQVDLHIKINYTDDFNQLRQIDQVISVDVMEGMPDGGGGAVIGPDGNLIQGGGGTVIIGPDGNPISGGEVSPSEQVPAQETFWQKVMRFFKGLFGLDSSAPTQPGTTPGMEVTPEQQLPVVKPSGKG